MKSILKTFIAGLVPVGLTAGFLLTAIGVLQGNKFAMAVAIIASIYCAGLGFIK